MSENQQLVIEFGDRAGFAHATGGDKAIVTVSFTVFLLKQDMELPGGFIEKVTFAPATSAIGFDADVGRALPFDKAIPLRPGDVNNTGWELRRERVFHLPRYPYPFKPLQETRFHGHIEIWPSIRWHDVKTTNEAVLPAKYPVSPSSATSAVDKIVRRRLRYVFDR